MDFEGAKYVCSPPPRDADSQAADLGGPGTGVFEIFSSDHCPFRFEGEGKLNAQARTCSAGFRTASPASRRGCRSCSPKAS